MRQAREWLTLSLGLLLAVATMPARAGARVPEREAAPDAGVTGSSNVWLEGHLGGATTTVAVEGSLAYIGEGPRLAILDISSLGAPVLVGRTPALPDLVEGVAVSGGYAYVADGDAGLWIVDVSDPGTPAVTGGCDTPGHAYALAVAGSYAYVADGFDGGLRVVDVSDPGAPVESRRSA